MDKGFNLMFFYLKYLLMSFFTLPKVLGAKYENGVRVLMYHSIDMGNSPIQDLYSLKWKILIGHLKLLGVKGFEFKKMSDEWPMEQKIVVLTFDDGFQDNFEVAIRLAKKKIPLTIFVTWDFINQPNYLRADQLQILSSMSNVEIGCHGKSHVPLTTLSQLEWREEIKLSKDKLESLLNTDITSMSFPHGKYTDEMVAYAHDIGLKRIATSDSGLNENQNEIKIKRTVIFKYDYNWVMIQKLFGLWDNLANKAERVG